MKAVIFNQHGGPDVLQYTEVPEPSIKANVSMQIMMVSRMYRNSVLSIEGMLRPMLVSLSRASAVLHLSNP